VLVIRLVTHQLVGLSIFFALGWAVMSLPESPVGLTTQALNEVSNSGVSNPVTAVLLNYRGYDTLLEVAVLLLALCALWSVSPRREERELVRSDRHPVIWSLLRVLLPLIILGSGYLLWVGAHAPGGAFQAGAMLGGGLVLMLIAGVPGVQQLCHNRLLHAFGLSVFLVIATLPLVSGRGILEYPPGMAKTQILLIESAATLSIAFVLAALFVGRKPGTDAEEAA
jgi:multisubunit Na+/H+ antiporter MnhB subunit